MARGASRPARVATPGLVCVEPRVLGCFDDRAVVAEPDAGAAGVAKASASCNAPATRAGPSPAASSASWSAEVEPSGVDRAGFGPHAGNEIGAGLKGSAPGRLPGGVGHVALRGAGSDVGPARGSPRLEIERDRHDDRERSDADGPGPGPAPGRPCLGSSTSPSSRPSRAAAPPPGRGRGRRRRGRSRGASWVRGPRRSGSPSGSPSVNGGGRMRDRCRRGRGRRRRGRPGRVGPAEAPDGLRPPRRGGVPIDRVDPRTHGPASPRARVGVDRAPCRPAAGNEIGAGLKGSAPGRLPGGVGRVALRGAGPDVGPARGSPRLEIERDRHDDRERSDADGPGPGPAAGRPCLGQLDLAELEAVEGGIPALAAAAVVVGAFAAGVAVGATATAAVGLAVGYAVS